MRFRMWLTLAAVLSAGGCNDPTNKVTAPAVDLPNSGDVDLDAIEANLVAQVGVPTRCVQLRYVSETGSVSTKQKGNSCTCSQGRLVSVTAVIWKGAYLNNVIGKASCFVPNVGTVVVAGPTTAVDPGGVLGGVFGLSTLAGGQLSGNLGCSLSSTVTSSRDPSNRLVICTWF